MTGITDTMMYPISFSISNGDFKIREEIETNKTGMEDNLFSYPFFISNFCKTGAQDKITC